jgi:S1-C subfamily serine protease
MLKGKYGSKLDYEGKVVQSCIHCHQVGESLRNLYRAEKKPVPESVLFPYPNPKTLGLVMDPKEKGRVASVTEGSPAAADQFQPGDEIVEMAGQPILSIADMQWVLHQQGAAGSIPVRVRRNGKLSSMNITLPRGWRQSSDISWRATSWELRRMVTGGLVLEDLSRQARQDLGIEPAKLGLQVKHVGQYGAHAAGKQAGFQKDDVVVSVDGQFQRMSESALIHYLLNKKQPGDRVAFVVQRGGRRVEMTLQLQQ